MRRVTLNLEQQNYLGRARFLAPHLRPLLQTVNTGRVEIEDSVAEEFRDAFTERLARVGFDKHYELTPEGQMLEALIDSFLGSI